MKTKLFFPTFFLITSGLSLHAFPAGGEPKIVAAEERKEERTFDYNEGQNTGRLTEEDSKRDNSELLPRNTMGSLSLLDLTSSDRSSSSSTEQPTFKDLNPLEQAGWTEKSLAHARQLIQAADLDDPVWNKVSARVRLAKKWVESIFNPPPSPPIDRWLGKKQRQYSFEEKNAAKLVELRAMALEVALPAWKATAAARKAHQLAQASKIRESAQQESTDCWAFFRKAPQPPIDLDADVLHKTSAVAGAWNQAHHDLVTRSTDLPEELKEAIALLFESNEKADSGKNQLAHAWVDELQYLEYAKESSGLRVEILMAQQRAEAALQKYVGTSEVNQNLVEDAIAELENLLTIISTKEDTAPLPVRKYWDAESNHLAYVVAVYRAQLHSSTFDYAVDAYRASRAEPEAVPDCLGALLDYVELAGATALQAWYVAIDAKLNTLPAESRERVCHSLNSPATTPSSAATATEETLTVTAGALTPQEEAARQRILDFRAECDSIQETLGSLKEKSAEFLDFGDEEHND